MAVPVRRSTALASLSQDHHYALLIASVLTRVTAVTARSSAMLFADFIQEHEASHFALEESVLLPVLPAGERAIDLGARVRADHRYLCEVARELGSGDVQPERELLISVGARLRRHVQLEERELFPYIEASLDAAALQDLGARLEAL